MNYSTKLLLLIPMTAALTFSGCSKDDSSDGADDGASKRTVSFTVPYASGYMQDATVCIDTNFNFHCDTDELSALTDSNGKASITIPTGASGGFGAIVEVKKDVTILTYDSSKAEEDMVLANSYATGELSDNVSERKIVLSTLTAYSGKYYGDQLSSTEDWNTYSFSGTAQEAQKKKDDDIYLSKEAYAMELALTRGLDASGVVWDGANTFERYCSKSMMLREVTLASTVSPATWLTRYDSDSSEGDGVTTALSFTNFGDISNDVVACEAIRTNDTFLPSLNFPSR